MHTLLFNKFLPGILPGDLAMNILPKSAQELVGIGWAELMKVMYKQSNTHKNKERRQKETATQFSGKRQQTTQEQDIPASLMGYTLYVS